MFIHIFTLLFYQISYKVTENRKVYDIPKKFGFESGGKFIVKVKNCNVDELLFIIATQDKIDKIKKEYNTQQLCKVNKSYFYHIKLFNENGEASGIIQEKGIYKSMLLSCRHYVNEYQVCVKYQNPNSLLSYNDTSYLTTFPSTFITILLLFFVYVINSMMYNCSIDNDDHFYLMKCFLYYILEKIMYYLWLENQSKKDDFCYNILYHLFYISAKNLFCSSITGFLLKITYNCRSQRYTNFDPILFCSVFINFLLIIILIGSAVIFTDYKPLIGFIFIFSWVFIILYFYPINYYQNYTSNVLSFYFQKKPNYFLVYSLFHILFSELLYEFPIYFPYYFYLLLDYSTILVLTCIGFIYRLRKETLYNFDIIELESTPNFI